MDYFRIVAAILILCSGSMLGFLFGKKFENRVKQIRMLLDSIQSLENEMLYYNGFLAPSFKNISKSLVYPLDDFYMGVATMMEKGSTLKQAFEKCSIKLLKSSDLNKNDIDLVLDMTRWLGNTGEEGQRKMFVRFRDMLSKNENDALYISKNRAALSRRLGILSGIAMAIIIL